MKNVTICDRDEKVIKEGQPSFKLTIAIEPVGVKGTSAASWKKELDLCESCAAIAVRGIANRVFLNDRHETEILSAIGCKIAPRKVVKRGAAEAGTRG